MLLARSRAEPDASPRFSASSSGHDDDAHATLLAPGENGLSGRIWNAALPDFEEGTAYTLREGDRVLGAIAFHDERWMAWICKQATGELMWGPTRWFGSQAEARVYVEEAANETAREKDRGG